VEGLALELVALELVAVAVAVAVEDWELVLVRQESQILMTLELC
jgi:hypothetical protein